MDSGLRQVAFTTARAGGFDGLHFHLRAVLGGAATIDALAERTTWATTYFKLAATPMQLAAGARIVVDCEAHLEPNKAPNGKARYSARVRVGEEGAERDFGAIEWEGV